MKLGVVLGLAPGESVVEGVGVTLSEEEREGVRVGVVVSEEAMLGVALGLDTTTTSDTTRLKGALPCMREGVEATRAEVVVKELTPAEFRVVDTVEAVEVATVSEKVMEDKAGKVVRWRG